MKKIISIVLTVTIIAGLVAVPGMVAVGALEELGNVLRESEIKVVRMGNKSGAVRINEKSMTRFDATLSTQTFEGVVSGSALLSKSISIQYSYDFKVKTSGYYEAYSNMESKTLGVRMGLFANTTPECYYAFTITRKRDGAEIYRQDNTRTKNEVVTRAITGELDAEETYTVTFIANDDIVFYEPLNVKFRWNLFKTGETEPDEEKYLIPLYTDNTGSYYAFSASKVYNISGKGDYEIKLADGITGYYAPMSGNVRLYIKWDKWEAFDSQGNEGDKRTRAMFVESTKPSFVEMKEKQSGKLHLINGSLNQDNVIEGQYIKYSDYPSYTRLTMLDVFGTLHSGSYDIVGLQVILGMQNTNGGGVEPYEDPEIKIKDPSGTEININQTVTVNQDNSITVKLPDINNNLTQEITTNNYTYYNDYYTYEIYEGDETHIISYTDNSVTYTTYNNQTQNITYNVYNITNNYGGSTDDVPYEGDDDSDSDDSDPDDTDPDDNDNSGKSLWEKIWDKVTDAIADIIGAIVDFIAGIIEMLVKAIKAVVEGLWGVATEFVTGLLEKAGEFFSLFGSESPLYEFFRGGEDFWEY